MQSKNRRNPKITAVFKQQINTSTVCCIRANGTTEVSRYYDYIV